MIGDGAYPSLLQGVSQQILQNRIPGQLTAQKNMLSDIVTGLRRRAGAEHKHTLTTPTPDSLHSLYLELGNTGYHLYINPLDGVLRVYDEAFSLVHTSTDSYLIASSASALRTVTQGGYTWFLNTEQPPALAAFDTSRKNPDHSGFVTVLTGAYSKDYTVTIKATGFSASYSYNTPNGSSAGDVDKSVPEYIADKLYVAMTADAAFNTRMEAFKDGAYLYIRKKAAYAPAFGKLKVTTSTGVSYMKTSNTMIVPLSIDLPANMPPEASGIICAVGSKLSTYAYYKWSDADSVWIESGDYGSVETLVNTPRRLYVDSGVFTFEAPVFEGRLAGNDENNPYSAILAYGITGISSYQGRLVFLSGGYACLSASNKPLRFMRSTVVDLRDDDPIEISAGAIASASFRYAIPFNKDLILVSAAHQAVIPSGNAGITPKNAQVLLSTTESIDVDAEPKVMGRTLMYSTAITPTYFGVGEMLPSQYSDSQYSANNLTAHIPRYIGGKCRNICSNSNTSTGFFLSDTALNEVLINEYLWSGDERVQNSWHKWEFNLPILSMHSAKGQLIIAFKHGSDVLLCVLDTRTASYQQSGFISSFADCRTVVTVVDNKFSLPLHLRDVALLDDLRLAQSAGALVGEPVGIEDINTSTWVVTTMRSFPAGTASIGWAFESAMTPSSALIRDKDEKPILTAHTNILRYMVNVKNTGEFNVRTEITGYNDYTGEDSALIWSSTELGLGSKQAVNYGTINIPVRAFSFDTDTTLSTDGTREMNIVSIEYTLRGVLKRKRM